MKVWRIVREKNLTDPWRPPEMNHRWNTDRHRVTYAALDPGTAVTEQLVYIKEVRQFGDRYLVEGEYSGTVEEAIDLPNGWDAWPHIPAVQTYGDDWLTGATAGALILPSALLPTRNIMINQRHPDFSITEIEVHTLSGLTRT